MSYSLKESISNFILQKVDLRRNTSLACVIIGKMWHNFSPSAKRRERLAELVTSFFLGKALLIVTHFAWIWFYPSSAEHLCWDKLHWVMLFHWPLSALALTLLAQIIIYSVEQSKRMIIYGTFANINLFISQTLYMSSNLLPDCFSLQYAHFVALLMGIVLLFLEARQFILLTKELRESSNNYSF